MAVGEAPRRWHEGLRRCGEDSGGESSVNRSLQQRHPHLPRRQEAQEEVPGAGGAAEKVR